MPTVDTTTITGGLVQSISDWVLGDDRQFSGDAQSSINPPPPGDLSLSDAYFTLKRSFADQDSVAIIQKHITPALTAAGQITAGLGGAISNLLFKIASGDFEALVVAGPVYYWDFRTITVGGVTQTIARGKVVYLPLVTQTDKAGTPAAFPNSGQPQFRGWINNVPNLVPNNLTFYNIGDVYFSSAPNNGNGAIFVCTMAGFGPSSAWFVIPSNAPAISPPSGFIPPVTWQFGNGPPASGLHATGEIVWNLSADPFNNNEVGWYCTAGGVPGSWFPFGLLSDVQ